MKTLLAMMMLTTTAFAQPVFLNMPSEHTGAPAMSIPTASQNDCENLMVKLSKADEANYYMSCSIVPFK